MMALTTWQSPHPDDLGEWLVGYQIMDVNVIIARCVVEDDARRIVRDHNAHDALVEALRAIDREYEIRKRQAVLCDIRAPHDITGDGRFGIAVATDAEAVEWQALNVKLCALVAARDAALELAKDSR